MTTKAEREARRAASLKMHAARIQRTYGITGDEYWQLYEFQGGYCYICRRARGLSKRLAVDHDHSCDGGHHPTNGCRKCVRGLLCGPCNRLLGMIKDDATRIHEYLSDPPYQRMRQQ